MPAKGWPSCKRVRHACRGRRVVQQSVPDACSPSTHGEHCVLLLVALASVVLQEGGARGRDGEAGTSKEDLACGKRQGLGRTRPPCRTQTRTSRRAPTSAPPAPTSSSSSSSSSPSSSAGHGAAVHGTSAERPSDTLPMTQPPCTAPPEGHVHQEPGQRSRLVNAPRPSLSVESRYLSSGSMAKMRAL